jgi:hypothetical protein
MHHSSRGPSIFLPRRWCTPRGHNSAQSPQWMHDRSRWILYFPMGLRYREGTRLISGGQDTDFFSLLSGLRRRPMGLGSFSEDLAESLPLDFFPENRPA